MAGPQGTGGAFAVDVEQPTCAGNGVVFGPAGVVGHIAQHPQPGCGENFGKNRAHEGGDDLPAGQSAVGGGPHALLDGRDTPPKSGVEYVRRLDTFLRHHGSGRIGSLIGRFYAMGITASGSAKSF